MITTIILKNPELRDAIVSLSAGIRQTNQENDIIFYQKNSLIFAFSEILSVKEIYEKSVLEYQSEQVFILETGRSVDTEHEIGDVVLPSVIMNYNSEIEKIEITKENRDNLIGKAKFLEIFEEQKDYFVENFGLSIGAIAVENTPENDDLNEKLLSVYAADVYTKNSLEESYEIVQNSTIATLLIIGISEGKKSKNCNKNSMIFLAENLLTTIRLLQEEENI